MDDETWAKHDLCKAFSHPLDTAGQRPDMNSTQFQLPVVSVSFFANDRLMGRPKQCQKT